MVCPQFPFARPGRYYHGLGARLAQRLARLEQLGLLESVGGENGDFLALELAGRVPAGSYDRA